MGRSARRATAVVLPVLHREARGVGDVGDAAVGVDEVVVAGVKRSAGRVAPFIDGVLAGVVAVEGAVAVDIAKEDASASTARFARVVIDVQLLGARVGASDRRDLLLGRGHD